MLKFENTSEKSFMCLSVSVSLFTLSLIMKFYNKLKKSQTNSSNKKEESYETKLKG